MHYHYHTQTNIKNFLTTASKAQHFQKLNLYLSEEPFGLTLIQIDDYPETYLYLTFRHPKGVRQTRPLRSRQIFRLLERFLQSKDLLTGKRGSGVFLFSIMINDDVGLCWKEQETICCRWRPPTRHLVSMSCFYQLFFLLKGKCYCNGTLLYVLPH